MQKSKAEQKLLKYVESAPNLHTSLIQIRSAVERIWAPDAPRIIQNYTDHGLAHISRVIEFSTSIQSANTGKKLIAIEVYLLLASIYLHDVGMQCDVARQPEIVAQATTYGARFDISLDSPDASSYTKEQQHVIRQNHHLLSIAWIDYAARTGNTTLGAAAQSIPNDVIDDLLDICKHHTKLPIADCPVALKFDPTGRKQFIASILRLADELDIDSNRISIATPKTFSLDPDNEFYWWLHNSIKISFVDFNVIQLIARLHPEDKRDFGDFIHERFIKGFATKNIPVLSILGQNQTQIHISNDSKVLQDTRADRFPADVREALTRKVFKSSDHLHELAEEVRTWLQAVQYEINNEARDDDHIQFTATLEQGTFRQKLLVKCISGEITVDHVRSAAQSLDLKIPQSWLISDKRVAKSAREEAKQVGIVQVFNLADFLSNMIWGSYFNNLDSLVVKDRIPDRYVDLACYKQHVSRTGETSKDVYSSLDDYLDSWLFERGKMHMSILGDFGSGKTWLCRHYAHRQLTRYLNDPIRQRLPLLITLRTFAKATTPEQLINDALIEQYKLSFIGSAYKVFQEANRRGKLLLILDGFDEMARQVDYQTVVDNFWALEKLVDESSKVILTSRTEYFRWAEESQKILAGEEYGRRTLALQPPKFEVLYVEPLDDGKIRELITKRVPGEAGDTVANKILGHANLAEMARKPVLVELLLAALDEVNADVLDNTTTVYVYATNKLLLRNIDTKRTFTRTAEKLFFLCELGWEMIRTGVLQIHFSSIPERIKSIFGDKIRDQHELDMWDFDLRNQTMLHRNAAGYYEFAHKSLAEFFTALKLAIEIGALKEAVKATYAEENGKPCEFLLQQADQAGLLATLGQTSLADASMYAVFQFLRDLLDDRAEAILSDILKACRNKSFEQVRYLASNCATLLAWRHKLAGRSLDGLCLRKALFVTTDLRGTTFRGSDLNSAVISDSPLDDKSLKGASFKKLVVTFVVKGMPPDDFRHAPPRILPTSTFDWFRAHLDHVQDRIVLSAIINDSFDSRELEQELSSRTSRKISISFLDQPSDPLGDYPGAVEALEDVTLRHAATRRRRSKDSEARSQ